MKISFFLLKIPGNILTDYKCRWRRCLVNDSGLNMFDIGLQGLIIFNCSLSEGLKMENIEIKEESQEEILPSSTVEDTCTVYIKEEDVKVEITETKGIN